MNLIAVFFSCGLGGVSRWALTRYASDHIVSNLPVGTIAVNVIGSFLIGFCFALFKDSVIPMPVRLAATTGFLGGFTTFSTYALETVTLIEKKQAGAAFLNFALQNGAGLVAVAAGVGAFKLLQLAVSSPDA